MKRCVLVACMLLMIELIFADDAPSQENIVRGKEAEGMILEGTVLKSFSTEVQYGVKYYYLVLYFGYTWLCEQATYRTTCYLQK